MAYACWLEEAGGGRERVDFDAIEPAIEDLRVDMIALDEALTALEARDSRKSDLVRLRYFAGLSIEQAAEALGVSVATANNDWSYAKSWLRLAMLGDEPTRSRG
jgi:DNA-directed RNA polymerase specialized sigma24 family protein